MNVKKRFAATQLISGCFIIAADGAENSKSFVFCIIVSAVCLKGIYFASGMRSLYSYARFWKAVLHYVWAVEGRSGNTHHALCLFIFSAVRGFGVGSREQLAAGRVLFVL